MNQESFTIGYLTHLTCSLFDLIVSLCTQGKQKDKQLGLSLSFILSLSLLNVLVNTKLQYITFFYLKLVLLVQLFNYQRDSKPLWINCVCGFMTYKYFYLCIYTFFYFWSYSILLELWRWLTCDNPFASAYIFMNFHIDLFYRSVFFAVKQFPKCKTFFFSFNENWRINVP